MKIDDKALWECVEALERVRREATKELFRRAMQRRFRKPLTVCYFDLEGKVCARFKNDRWQLAEIEELGDERGEPNSIVIEDARGRKASAFIAEEVEALVKRYHERRCKNPGPRG